MRKLLIDEILSEWNVIGQTMIPILLQYCVNIILACDLVIVIEVLERTTENE
jgi:hypothetical protein